MRQRFGKYFTVVGLLGAAALACAFGLTAWALAHGVHCPECDSQHLTAREFTWWKGYFAVKDSVYGGATLLLLAATPLATPRRWPFVLGFVLALLAFMLTPR